MATEILMQTGFGREPIMPPEVMPLGGNGLIGREFTGVNDTLYITCVAFCDGTSQPVLLYTMDTLKSEKFILPLREAVSEATGIPGERILFSSTHTHNAPAVYEDKLAGTPAYREVFRKSAIESAKTALSELAPTTMLQGTANAEGMAFSRHYVYEDGFIGGPGSKSRGKIVGHADPADTQVQLIRLCREGKQDILMMSFPVHGTSMSSEANKLISADVPGAIRAALEADTGLHVAYFIGAAGNQVPKSRGEDDHGLCVKDYGKAVARFICEAMPNMTPAQVGPIQLRWNYYQAPSNKEKIHMYQEACEVVKAYSEGGQAGARPYVQKHGLSSVWEAVAIKRRYNAEATVEFPLSVMRMGQLSFAFAPYEMFAPNGQYIKDNPPDAMTFVVTCANGAKGYLPMEKAFDYGVYECFVTLAKPGTAEAVAQTYVDMLKELKEVRL